MAAAIMLNFRGSSNMRSAWSMVTNLIQLLLIIFMDPASILDLKIWRKNGHFIYLQNFDLIC